MSSTVVDKSFDYPEQRTFHQERHQQLWKVAFAVLRMERLFVRMKSKSFFEILSGDEAGGDADR